MACGESFAPTATVLLWSLRGYRASVSAHNDVGDAVAVGIAHGDSSAVAIGAALGVEPRQWRVPGDIYMAVSSAPTCIS